MAVGVASSFGILPVLGAEPAAPAPPVEYKRKIKLGVVGNGGRGAWLANLFKQHGGYEIYAVADYFQEVADKCGDALGVDKSRRFSTLSGYKKLIESGVEAVAVETPPYFIPEQVRAVVEAGLHVYMAKPVAVDAWGCSQIEAAAKLATQKNQCFLVDYQMPGDPANQEVRRRIYEPGFGKIAQIATVGLNDRVDDPPLTATIESRISGLIWVNDIALGADNIGNYDIHVIDAAIWVVGQRPVAATGVSRICRPDPHGDARDVCSVIYDYPGGVVHNHFGLNLKNQMKNEMSCTVHGQYGYAHLGYWGMAVCRSAEDSYQAEIKNLYEAGASRNIATFYQNITGGHFQNETVARALDGALACFLGREAAARQTRLTMYELIKENQRLEVDLKGLKT